jgi:hypothetical protein
MPYSLGGRNMCLMIYICGKHSLQLKPWHNYKPRFHVVELYDHEKKVKEYFDFPHVRKVGSKEGCGCAFNYSKPLNEEKHDTEEVIKTDEARKNLVEYIRKNKVVQLYSCQGGDESIKPTKFRNIKDEDILNKDFFFNNNELLTIIK